MTPATHPHPLGHHHAKPLQRLYALLQPEFRDIGVVVFFSILVSVLSLAVPMTVEALVNTVAFGRFMQPLAMLALVLFVFLGFGAALRALQTWIAEIIQRRLLVRVVAELTSRLTRVRHDAYDGHHGPELMNRFFDVMTVQKAAAMLVLDGVAIVVQTIVGMILLAFYHPYLLGFDIVLLVLMAATITLLGRGAVRTSIDESYAKYNIAGWLEQLAQFPITVKHQANWTLSRADTLTCDYLTARHRHFVVLMRQICFALGLQAVVATALLSLGGWLVITGQLTLGQLVAAELVVTVIIGSFAKLGKHIESFYDLMAAVDKLGHLFDLPLERETGDDLPASEAGIEIRLSNVEHRTTDGTRTIVAINDFVASGEMVAVTGPSGSGKSRLLELLYALREPTQGHIEFDRADLRNLRLSTMRKQVALVRGTDLFEGTVCDNLKTGREIELHTLRRALEAVGMHADLMCLPQGLETHLSPGGAPLSGSQRTRLALARAIVSRPRLLLIDQILDGLAVEQSMQILDAVREFLPQTTIVLVSTRRHLLHRCQRSLSLGDSERTLFPSLTVVPETASELQPA